MTLTMILNAVLAVAVVTMVLAPLVWAVLSERRDDPRPAPTTRASVPEAPHPQPRRPAPQPRMRQAPMGG